MLLGAQDEEKMAEREGESGEMGDDEEELMATVKANVNVIVSGIFQALEHANPHSHTHTHIHPPIHAHTGSGSERERGKMAASFAAWQISRIRHVGGATITVSGLYNLCCILVDDANDSQCISHQPGLLPPPSPTPPPYPPLFAANLTWLICMYICRLDVAQRCH